MTFSVNESWQAMRILSAVRGESSLKKSLSSGLEFFRAAAMASLRAKKTEVANRRGGSPMPCQCEIFNSKNVRNSHA